MLLSFIFWFETGRLVEIAVDVYFFSIFSNFKRIILARSSNTLQGNLVMFFEN